MQEISKDSQIITEINLKEYTLNKKKLSKFQKNTNYEEIKEYIKSIKEEAINAEGEINYKFNAGELTYDEAAQLASVYVKLQINPNVTLDKLKEKIANNNNFYENILNYYIAQDYSKNVEKELSEKKEQLEELLKKNTVDSSEMSKAKKNKSESIQKKDFIKDLNDYCEYRGNKIFNEYFTDTEVKKYLEYIFDFLGLNIINGVIDSKEGNITYENLAKAYIILNKLKKIKENNRDSGKKNIESEIKLSVKTHLDNVLLQIYQKNEKINEENEKNKIAQQEEYKKKIEEAKNNAAKKKEQIQKIKEEEKAQKEKYKDYKPKANIKNKESAIQELNTFLINNGENVFDKYAVDAEINAYINNMLKLSNFELKDNSLKSKEENITYESLVKMYILFDSLKRLEQRNFEPNLKNLKKISKDLIINYYKNYLRIAYDKDMQPENSENEQIPEPKGEENVLSKEDELNSKLSELQNKLNNWNPINIHSPEKDENSKLAEEYLFHITEYDPIKIVGVDKLENIISFEVNAAGLIEGDNILINKYNSLNTIEYTPKPFDNVEFKTNNATEPRIRGKNENNEVVEFEANTIGNLTSKGLLIYGIKKKLGTFYLSYEPNHMVEISLDEDELNQLISQ